MTGLRLGYCQIGPVGCASLAKLRGLTLLEISGCAGVTDAALCMLSPLCAVTDLTLSDCVDFGNLGEPEGFDLCFFGVLPVLRSVLGSMVGIIRGRSISTPERVVGPMLTLVLSGARLRPQ